jgi:hypothetical protein
MSAYLVDQIDGTAERGSLTSALEKVYCHLAQTWVNPFPSLRETPNDWRAYSRRIKELNDRVEVRPAKYISGGKWSSLEILNSLRHVEVLLCVGLALEADHWTLKRCAPMQQHLADGEADVPSKIADLEGKDDQGLTFSLEAYGGADYRNNSKLALDLNALRQSKKARLLLAAHRAAWPASIPTTLTASCEKRNGGPFKIEAAVATKTWEQDSVLAIEVTGIAREATRPKDFS